MSATGDDDLLVRARSALLDALTAHREAVVVIGAQALYLHTHGIDVALAEATKDSDIALNPTLLANAPFIEAAMAAAGFRHDPEHPQPGSWLTADGIPVDLMVAEALAGPAAKHRRGARIPPHSKRAARRAVGLEAAMVDRSPMLISSLTTGDPRELVVNVAGPAALLVAKLHKVGERRTEPDRLVDKDAYDIYRLLVAVPAATIGESIDRLVDDPLAGRVTIIAMTFLREMFAAGPGAVGSAMAGRAEAGIGNPDLVAAAATALANELLIAIG